MTRNSSSLILAVELVDVLGILFWIAILSGAILHAVHARIPRRSLMEHLCEASLLIVCLVTLAGIIGYVTSGKIAALGGLIAMSLWCVVGFLLWSTSRWRREHFEKENSNPKNASRDGPDSKCDDSTSAR